MWWWGRRGAVEWLAGGLRKVVVVGCGQLNVVCCGLFFFVVVFCHCFTLVAPLFNCHTPLPGKATLSAQHCNT